MAGPVVPGGSVREVIDGVRFVAKVAPFLRQRPSVATARAVVRQRLKQRGSDFLRLMRLAVFANPTSPYRQLLTLAGCELGEVERLVRQQGLDGALRTLVHPLLGPLEPTQVKQTFLEAIGVGDGAGRVMMEVWRDAELLRVERREPAATFNGKILHLHQRRTGANEAD